MKTRIQRSVWAAGAAVAFMGLASSAGFAADAPQHMVLGCYAGDIQEYFQTEILPDFEKQHNVKVTYLPGVSTATISKLQAQKSNPQIDVACLDDGPQY